MITNKGKGIIARSLAGQISSPFSYIALGVGAKPELPVTVLEKTAATWISDNTVLGDGIWGLETDTNLVKLGNGSTAWNSLGYIANGIQYESQDIVTKTKLDFEAFRVPVSGSSVIFESGKTKIVLTASLPSAQRYEFSEIGVFSSEFNSILTTEAPRMLYTFSASEGWEYHSGSSIIAVPYAGSISENGIDISVPNDDKTVFIASDSSVFFTENRNNQRMRVYQDALILRGDLSTIDIDVTPPIDAEWTVSGDHVHVTGIPINLTKARSDDELKISFAVLNKVYADISSYPADAVRIVVNFMQSESQYYDALGNPIATEYAKMQIQVNDGEVDVNNQIPSTTDFTNNGYYSVTVPIESLVTSANFSWENITVAQVFVEVDPAAGKANTDYYVAIDAIRFDSNNDNNPAYGMSAYSVVQNSSASTEIKELQTETQLEYKIVLEVD